MSKSIATEKTLLRQRNLCCDIIPLSHLHLYRVSILVARTCLSCAPSSVVGDIASLSWAIERLFRARQSASVVHGKAPLSRALCFIPTSLLLVQCPFPIATQMNSVATWDLLTMTELCHDLKFSCRDLVSTTYTSLCCDTEKSYCDIKLLATIALCHNTEKLCHDVGYFFMPILCRDSKAYVTTKKSPRQDNLCHDTECFVATLNLMLPPFPVLT